MSPLAMNDILLSVVLSFRDEEKVLEELIHRLKTVLETLTKNYEIIFVNDASDDNSGAMLKARAAQDPTVKVINMSRTFGVSQCALAGLAYSSGQAVITMDADLQDPPEVIPELVQRWREGADVVYTVRKSRASESTAKLAATRWAYRILRLTSDIDMPVESGDFKLMSRRVVNSLMRLNEKDPFLRGLVRWVGYKQVPVYYDRDPRFAGESHFAFYGRKAVGNFISGLTSFSLLPLHGALLLGFAVSFGAFAYLIGVFIMKYLGWNLPGWSAIMATMLFLGGTQLITIGVLGIYIGKIYEEAKGRPSYIIESLVGFEAKRSQAERPHLELASGGSTGFDRGHIRGRERPPGAGASSSDPLG
jgi:glycosyltransferase involved in cell wall biosynthesis